MVWLNSGIRSLTGNLILRLSLSQVSIGVAGMGLKGQVLISSFPMRVLVIRKRKKQGETSFSSFSSRVSATFPDARSSFISAAITGEK
ncbi:hypothetical protein Prudu_006367 [Prunus dulcis]|uniref:Uncharacterized protein n=1 Tax=Prunus dulcis TaxID=3755 RepID=A0A4Y1QZQ3_PRUDU|nr:hypothetical protein Prudu_006367 [Prunus dulcis]